ncbi:MAG: ClpXP protease specificity-enhancing factor SspB, partial [Gammaproteobacteria bacterium]|nr:ClpXP protease specificity-enhancing factor SspB [Gammaproteobacteria bacterium]
VTVPVEAVLGIIAKENGEGMWFPVDPSEPEPDNDGSGESVSKTDRQTDKKKPNLKIIK